MRFRYVVALLALAFSFALSPASEAADSRFWTPPGSRGSCERGNSVIPLVTEKRVYGWKPSNLGVKFASDLSRNISRGVGNGRYDFSGLASELAKAAGNKAFTVPVFEGPRRPSPIFLTSSILITLAYAVDLLDSRGAWGPNERQAVIAWGNKLDKNQNQQRNPSHDSVAAFAAARMTWGAATGQSAVFNKGMSSFKRTGRLLSPDGYFESNPRDNNEVVALMVLAAAAADGVGKNAFGMKFRGLTLHEAVQAHSDNTVRMGPVAVTEGDTGHTGKYLKPNGYASHLAWIPIYLARHPRTAAAGSVRQLERTMRKYSRNKYNGTSLGGATGCFWR